MPRPNHKPSSNGCGIPGFSVKDEWKFESCCDKHDHCYDTCDVRKTKEYCDNEFKECMNTLCKKITKQQGKYKQCLDQAKLYVQMTTIFGCNSFVSSREKACLCGKDEL
eukprot:TRINITY_DN854_c0_g1_i1.p1 TRINITY_DN854_c0_g1~~TRINITY_DN854_c0_g1_i1.p1  ORF type:complete len:109 (+),score=6.54 TRINITY_DN854_c0_g1_i1:257-583(+)